MVWGHATSPDLVTWTALTTNNPATWVLKPMTDKGQTWSPFTGSAVAITDARASAPPCSCPSGSPCIAAIFTRHSNQTMYQHQALAPSCHAGMSFDHQGTPVLDNPEYAAGRIHARDPKVFWFQSPAAAQGKWVMVLAAGDRVRIYDSPTLVPGSWSHRSDVVIYPRYEIAGPFVETPDLVELAVENRPGARPKWALLFGEGFIPPGICSSIPALPLLSAVRNECKTRLNNPSRGLYLVGDFDGLQFVAESRPPGGVPGWPLDSGPDFYAAQTWIVARPLSLPSNLQGATRADPGRPQGATPLAAPLPRRVMVGWQNNWRYAHLLPTTEWRGHASI
ncbi:MAG: hypothetical protein ACREMG_03715, partial [Gemmatimonadales bacterium]